MTRLDTNQIRNANPGAEGGSPGGTGFLSNLENILEQLENSPQLQQMMMQATNAEEMMGENMPDNQSETPSMKADQNNQSETNEPMAETDNTDLVGLVKDIEENVGGQVTVSQIRMFMENNPEQVERLKDNYL